MMEEVILGILLNSEKTIYELNQILEKDFKLMFCASLGCLEIVLKKLIKNNEINFFTVQEGGRNKKKYVINEAGKKHFLAWMNQAAFPSQLKDPTLSRVYFLDVLNEENQYLFCKQAIALQKKNYDLLLTDYEERRHCKKEQNKSFDLSLLEYHLQICKMNIRWYKKIIRELKQEKKPA